MTAAIPVEEQPWVLEVNGVRLASGTSSPDDGEALTAGRLLSDGFVSVRADLHSIAVEPVGAGSTLLRAEVDGRRFDAAMAERRHCIEHGCGLLHFVHCAPDALRRTRAAGLPAQSDLTELLRALFAACDERAPGGGVHGAALSAGSTLRPPAVDVSRHAAVERAVGAAFLAGDESAPHGLVLTARISGQIALAAARSGLAWVASRSVPTSVAVSIAECAGLPLIARAAGRDARVFAGTG